MGWYPCGCCDDICTYQASDGTLYSNTFGAALDGGWTQGGGTDLTFATSGGRLQATGTPSSGHGESLYRSDALPGTWNRIILECDVIQYNSNTTILGISLFTDAFARMGTLNAQYGAGNFRCVLDGSSSTVSQTPNANGNKLSVIVTKTAGGFLTCFFVDEVEIYNGETTTVTPTDPFIHYTFTTVLASGPDTYGEFDNYTIQLDS